MGETGGLGDLEFVCPSSEKIERLGPTEFQINGKKYRFERAGVDSGFKVSIKLDKNQGVGPVYFAQFVKADGEVSGKEKLDIPGSWEQDGKSEILKNVYPNQDPVGISVILRDNPGKEFAEIPVKSNKDKSIGIINGNKLTIQCGITGAEALENRKKFWKKSQSASTATVSFETYIVSLGRANGQITSTPLGYISWSFKIVNNENGGTPTVISKPVWNNGVSKNTANFWK